MLDPSNLVGLNLYAYCGNNPVIRADFTGCFWDYVLDAAFLVWGVCDVINNPNDVGNWVSLGVDLVFAVVPFVPSGAGQVIKVGNRIDDAIDVANAINKIDNLGDMSKVTMIGRNMDRVTDTAKLINQADNLYDAWAGYDKTAKGAKKFFHNLTSMGHNGMWLYGKLRSGYTVIDIGLKTTHKGVGLWYGTEQVVSIMWQTRNLWKIPINIYM